MDLDYAQLRGQAYGAMRALLQRFAPSLRGDWRVLSVPTICLGFIIFLTLRLVGFYLGLIVRTLVPLLLSPFIVLYLYVDMLVLGLYAIVKTATGREP